MGVETVYAGFPLYSWTVFGIASAIDISVAIFLYRYSQSQRTDGKCQHFFSCLDDYGDQLADMVILATLRLSINLMAAALVFRYGRVTSSKESKGPSPLLDPLLDRQSLLENGQEKGKEEMGRDVYERKVRADLVKNSILFALFALNTTTGLAIAIKCVDYKFHSEPLEGGLLLFSIVLCNLDFFSLKRALDVHTDCGGIMVKAIHKHALYYKPETLAWKRCKVCGNSFRGKKVKVSYCCSFCDFTCCTVCFKKQSRVHGEGIDTIRTDKGVKAAEELSTMSFFLRALSLMRPHWMLFAFSMVFLVINTFASLAIPSYQGHIFDTIYARDKPRFWHDVFYTAIFTVATGVFGSLQSIGVQIASARVVKTVRTELFEKIILQDIAYFDGTKTGQIMSLLSNDVSRMLQPIRFMLNSIVSNALTLVGALVMCMITSWKLCALSCTSIVPMTYITSKYASWASKNMFEVYSALGDALSIASEALRNIRTVRAFSTEHVEVGRFEGLVDTMLSKTQKNAVYSTLSSLLTTYIDLGANVLILAYGGYLAINNPDELSPGQLVTFIMYWDRIGSAFSSLNNTLQNLTSAAGAAERVLSLMDTLPTIDPDAGVKLKRENLEGNIEVRDVVFTYQMRPDKQVLQHVNLTVPANSTVALVGKSGAGKSTILHLVLRFYDLYQADEATEGAKTQGEILLDGVNIRDINMRSLHRNMGLVMQDTQLFGGTLLENISYGLDEDEFTMQDVQEAAVNANADEFIQSFENGYETRIGEKGVRLSGGQKQRIALARCFLRKPKIILLDEATSALDTESEALVQTAIDRLIAKGGCTVLVVAHRLSTVVNADKIAVLEDGKVVEQGKHAELLEQDGVYSNLVAKQLQGPAPLSERTTKEGEGSEGQSSE